MTLHQYLDARLRAAYRQLGRALAGVSEEEALYGASEEWRQERFGVGLDGSIRGILFHLAAWKRVAAEGLERGAFPPSESALDAALPWDELLGTLDREQARLQELLRGLANDDLERALVWEGQEMTVRDVFTHLIEHDHYHAGQINLLRQQRDYHLSPQGR